jgi:hypothetical protein
MRVSYPLGQQVAGYVTITRYRLWLPRSRSYLCRWWCSFSVSAQRPTPALNKGFRAEAGSKKGCPVSKRRAAVVAEARVDSIEFHGGLPMRPSGLLGSAQVLWDQPYLTQDNAWCIPPDENLFWFVEGDDWTAEITEVLDRCLERISYFGMAWITY